MNGVDYISQEDSGIMVKFVGTDKSSELIPMFYIVVFLSTALFILLFAAITVFCFGLKKMYQAKKEHSEASADIDRALSSRGGGAVVRPQVEEPQPPAPEP